LSGSSSPPSAGNRGILPDSPGNRSKDGRPYAVVDGWLIVLSAGASGYGAWIKHLRSERALAATATAIRTIRRIGGSLPFADGADAVLTALRGAGNGNFADGFHTAEVTSR
jgi:hypothetical protein